MDDGLAPLFEYLDESGLAESTMVVVTSDHGEMGGDHWLFEKLGYWDESYQVPLIVVDPRSAADGGRGGVVDAVTESVDVLPTICDFLGVDVPLQADGWSLAPFVRGEAAPTHWRDTAHYEWNFSDPANQLAEKAFGIPMSQCALEVGRGPRYKYVQFAAAPGLFPPLLFDLSEDPGQTRNLLAEKAGRVRGRLAVRAGTRAVAHAHGRADVERQPAACRTGPRAEPRRLGLIRASAAGPRSSRVKC